MTTQLEQAARLALEALEIVTGHFTRTPSTLRDSEVRGEAHKAITALRAALEQPAQDEPCPKCNGLGYYDEGHENDDGSMSGGNYVECEKCKAPAQDEPVAYWHLKNNKGPCGWSNPSIYPVTPERLADMDKAFPEHAPHEPYPLYTRPQAREPLTSQERDARRWRFLMENSYDSESVTQFHVWEHSWEPHSQTGEPTEWKQRVRGIALIDFIDRAIEAAHGIKV